MAHTIYDVLLNALGTAQRNEAQRSTAATTEVRGVLTTLLNHQQAATQLAAAPGGPAAYDPHPAYSDWAALNAWLLGRAESAHSHYGTMQCASYKLMGYLGINASLLASNLLAEW